MYVALRFILIVGGFANRAFLSFPSLGTVRDRRGATWWRWSLHAQQQASQDQGLGAGCRGGQGWYGCWRWWGYIQPNHGCSRVRSFPTTETSSSPAVAWPQPLGCQPCRSCLRVSTRSRKWQASSEFGLWRYQSMCASGFRRGCSGLFIDVHCDFHFAIPGNFCCLQSWHTLHISYICYIYFLIVYE